MDGKNVGNLVDCLLARRPTPLEAYFDHETAKVTYEAAVAECASQGAQLAVIDSAEKNAFAQEACGCRSCWLGLRWSADRSAWVSTFGLTLS